MKITILTVLLTAAIILQINQCSGQDDDKYLSKFKNLTARKSDCDPEKTAKTIKLLSEDNDSSNEDGKPLWIARTQFKKLRSYLAKKGFMELPGSLTFLNNQDDTLHLECSKDSNKNTRWTSQGRQFDRQFNDQGFSSNKLVDDAPSTHLYFRRIICSQINGGKNGCQHFFYVVTRPFPIIEKNQNYREGDKIKFKCEINPCLYSNTKSKECTQPHMAQPRFHPPVTLGWTLLKDKKKINTEAPANKKTEMKITVKNFSGTAKDEFGTDITNFPISATIEIFKAEKKHAGFYECVIVDDNGVTSTPDHVEILFGGTVHVHVREWWWLFVPLIVIGILIVLIIMCACCCPRSMEHDDGTKFTKEELDFQAKEAKTSVDQPTAGESIVSVNPTQLPAEPAEPADHAAESTTAKLRKSFDKPPE